MSNSIKEEMERIWNKLPNAVIKVGMKDGKEIITEIDIDGKTTQARRIEAMEIEFAKDEARGESVLRYDRE